MMRILYSNPDRLSMKGSSSVLVSHINHGILKKAPGKRAVAHQMTEFSFPNNPVR